MLVALAATARAPVSAPRARAHPDVAEDGALRARGGHLIVDEELRRFLDHELAGGAPVRGRLEATFARRLPAAAAAEARELLDHYLDLRAAAHDLPATPDLDARRRAVRTLRRDFLGDEEAAALFASEDADVDAALARRRGQPALTAADAAALGPLATMRREAGLSPAAVQDLRVRTFGPEAAARLAELDRARASFRARVEDFHARRAATSDPEAVARIEDELFSPTEKLRVEALDRVHSLHN